MRRNIYCNQIILSVSLCLLIYACTQKKNNEGDNLMAQKKVQSEDVVDICQMPKLVLNKNKEGLTLVFQYISSQGSEQNCRLDTFYVSLDSKIGDLRKAIKKHFLFNNKYTFQEHLEFSIKKNGGSINDTLVQSYKVLSRDILLVTDSLVSYEADVKSSDYDFFHNLASYILEKGDKYIIKSGLNQINLYSYLKTIGVNPSGTSFIHIVNSKLDEAKIIQEYLNSVGFERVNYNYKFLILGEENMTIEEIGLKNYNVVLYFTINFGVVYPDDGR